jgi:hypothetical protein
MAGYDTEPTQLTPHAKQAEHAAGLWEEFRRPIADLPPISNRTWNEADAYWGRRVLRPEGEGEHFRNLPVLGFGIRYEGDQAILTVPTTEGLNWVVQYHNPGGFTVVESGFEASDAYLGLLARRCFTKSTSTHLSVSGVADKYRVFRYREARLLGVGEGELDLPDPIIDSYIYLEDDVFNDEREENMKAHIARGASRETALKYRDLNISTGEHDMVDHGALVALDPSGVDAFARYAEGALRLPYDVRQEITGTADRTLDIISAYLIAPHSTDAQGRTYKDFLWEGISAGVAALNDLMRPQDQTFDDIRDFDERMRRLNEAIEEVAQSPQGLRLDRAAIDANSERMRAIPAGTLLTRSLGTVAVAPK